MTDPINSNEFRLRGGSKILGYIEKFSSTEKVVFGSFVAIAIITAFSLLYMLSDSFKVSIPRYGGELKEGIIGLPRTINPILSVTDVDRDISSLVYSGLMKYQDGKLVPDIAKSYTISSDNLTYDFILRDDVRFSDGQRLTADDVEFTVEKIQDQALKSPRRADWVNVSIKKISDNEIQFILKQPYSPFIFNTTVGILPKHIWGKVNDSQFIFSQYNIEPIGSGPYRYSAINRDSGGIPVTYSLVNSGDFYGGKIYLKYITFYFFTDQDEAISALGDGSIQSLAAIPPSAASNILNRSSSDFKVLSSPLPRVFGVFINQSQSSILADKVVRQALNMSVDRNDIIKNVLNGYGEAIDGPLPAGIDTGTSTDTKSHTKEAQALLEKNGWKKNQNGIYGKKTAKSATTTLSFELDTADAPDLKATANALKTAWNNLGADVTVKIFDQSDLYESVIRQRKFDALLFGEQIGKDKDLFAFWHSSQRNAPGLNISMYANSKVDKLLENIRTMSDEDAKNDSLKDLYTMIRSDLPAIFLYSPDFIYVVPKQLQGINMKSITLTSDRWNTVTKWFIETEKVWKIFQ